MKLCDYLKQNRIKQADFARTAGVSQGYVSQILSGKYKPKGNKAIRWSAATNWLVTPHELNSEDYPNERDGLPRLPLSSETGTKKQQTRSKNENHS